MFKKRIVFLYMIFLTKISLKNIFAILSNIFKILLRDSFLKINCTYHRRRRLSVSAFSHLSSEAWHLVFLCDFSGCEGPSAVTSMWQWQTVDSVVDSFHSRGHFCPLTDDSWLWRAEVPWSVSRTRLRQI